MEQGAGRAAGGGSKGKRGRGKGGKGKKPAGGSNNGASAGSKSTPAPAASGKGANTVQPKNNSGAAKGKAKKGRNRTKGKDEAPAEATVPAVDASVTPGKPCSVWCAVLVFSENSLHLLGFPSPLVVRLVSPKKSPCVLYQNVSSYRLHSAAIVSTALFDV